MGILWSPFEVGCGCLNDVEARAYVRRLATPLAVNGLWNGNKENKRGNVFTAHGIYFAIRVHWLGRCIIVLAELL